MKKISFEQDRRLSRDTLFLEEDRLIVSTNAAGLKAEKTIRLRDISPGLERRKKVFFSFVIVPIVLAMGMVLAASKLLHQQSVPQELVVAPVIGFVIALWYVGVGFLPVEVTIFRSNAGAVLIEIYRPKGRTIAYEEFVAALAESIKSKNPSSLSDFGI